MVDKLSDMVILDNSCKKLEKLCGLNCEDGIISQLEVLDSVVKNLDNWAAEVQIGGKIQEKLKNNNDEIIKLVDNTRLLLNKIKILSSNLKDKKEEI